MLPRPEEEKKIINLDNIKAFYNAIVILSNAKEDEISLHKIIIHSAGYIKKQYYDYFKKLRAGSTTQSSQSYLNAKKKALLDHIKIVIDNFNSLPVKLSQDLKQLLDAIYSDIQKNGSDHLELMQVEDGVDPIIDLLQAQDLHAGSQAFFPVCSNNNFTGLSLTESQEISEGDQSTDQVLEATPIDYLNTELDVAIDLINNTQHLQAIQSLERLRLAIQKNLEETKDRNAVIELESILRRVLVNLSTAYNSYFYTPKTNEKLLEDIDYINMAIDALDKIQTLCRNAEHDEEIESVIIRNNLIINNHRRLLLIKNAADSDSDEVKEKARKQILEYIAEIQNHVDGVEETLEQCQDEPSKISNFNHYYAGRNDLALANFDFAVFLYKISSGQLEASLEILKYYHTAIEIIESIPEASRHAGWELILVCIQKAIANVYNGITSWYARRYDHDANNYSAARTNARNAQLTLNIINLDNLLQRYLLIINENLPLIISTTGENLIVLYTEDAEIANKFIESKDWLSAIKHFEDLILDVESSLGLKIFKNTTIEISLQKILFDSLYFLSTAYYQHSLNLGESEQAIDYMQKAINSLCTVQEMQKKHNYDDYITGIAKAKEDLTAGYAILMIKHYFNLIIKLNNVEDKLKDVNSKNKMLEYISHINFHLDTLSEFAEGCQTEEVRINLRLDFDMCKLKSAEANFILGNYLLQLHKKNLNAETKPEQPSAVNNFLVEAITKYKKTMQILYKIAAKSEVKQERPEDNSSAQILLSKCHEQLAVCRAMQKSYESVDTFSKEKGHSQQFFSTKNSAQVITNRLSDVPSERVDNHDQEFRPIFFV